MNTPDLREGDALLIVNLQNDFCPDGAPSIPSGDRVVPVLNAWIAAARRAGIPVYGSRDRHPWGYPTLEAEGGKWPPHCLQDTSGAAFHPGLRLPADVLVVTKGTRFDPDQDSAFDETGLHGRLGKDGVRRLWAGGLARDVCVCESVLDACGDGYEVHLIPAGSLPVSWTGGADAVRRMREAGVIPAEEGS